jgi:signal peptidase I
LVNGENYSWIENMEQDYQNTVLDTEETQEEETGLLRVLIDILETLILSVILFFLINAVSARIKIDGSSMEPTLHNGEFVLVSKLNYKFGEPERGDVIVFDFPQNITQEYIKRVIGLPGETVRIEDGKVYIDGKYLKETYIQTSPRYQGEWTVMEDTLFVLGDNRNNSSDSHNWGMVPEENVVGEAFLVYWPPSSWGLVKQMNPVSASE